MVTELRALAKEQGLKGILRLPEKSCLSFNFISKESQAPVAPPRKEGKRRAVDAKDV